MSWHRPNSTAGKITSPFGPRGPIANAPDASRDHLGVDLRAGTLGVTSDIYAATAGTVRRIYQTPIGAWVLELDHGSGVRTRYAHMQRAGIAVKAGAKVTGGQRVAAASNSGAPTVHLHFEVLINGVQTDPVPFLQARGVDLTVTAVANPGGGTGGSITTPTIPGRPAPLEEEDMPTAKEIVDELLSRDIPVAGSETGKTTNLHAFLSWNDPNIEGTRALISAVKEDTASTKAVLIEGSWIDGVHYSGLVQIGAAILKAITEIPVKVWTGVNVWRGGKPVSVLQDLADTGTLTRDNQKDDQ